MAERESSAKALDACMAEASALLELWIRDPDPEAWSTLAHGCLDRFVAAVDVARLALVGDQQ